jgi:ParB family chromosome partitioning protein
MEKKGLGRGLGALIPDYEAPGSLQLSVERERIAPNPVQPRHSFDEVTIDELASSIREKGLIQPLVVRRRGNGYELIAGERRLRAATKAGLREVPVIVREASDPEAFQLALIENLQRENLNPIDEARGYKRLHEEFGRTQEEIADRLGKSRPTIANSIRMLQLPLEIQKEVADGKLAAGQARALLGLEREAIMLSAARVVITKGLSTRETERLVRRLKSVKRERGGAVPTDVNLTSLIEDLQRYLGTKVRLAHKVKTGKGKIEIDYYSKEDFDRILGMMMGNAG